MKVGTKSLLFGVHQFLWHPITVLMAWVHLYGRPGWKELICILIHDWGYWRSPNMDGPEGEKHPELGAKLAGKLLGQEYSDLCLYHSRHYAKRAGKEPSRLCWADKFSIAYEPWWLYLCRAWLSGELVEYRQNSAAAQCVPLKDSHKVWFEWIKNHLATQGENQQGIVKMVHGSLY